MRGNARIEHAGRGTRKWMENGISLGKGILCSYIAVQSRKKTGRKRLVPSPLLISVTKEMFLPMKGHCTDSDFCGVLGVGWVVVRGSQNAIMPSIIAAVLFVLPKQPSFVCSIVPSDGVEPHLVLCAFSSSSRTLVVYIHSTHSHSLARHVGFRRCPFLDRQPLSGSRLRGKGMDSGRWW